MRLRREAPAPVADPARGIELRGVGHAYGDRVVLADLDLHLTERRIGVGSQPARDSVDRREPRRVGSHPGELRSVA